MNGYCFLLNPHHLRHIHHRRRGPPTYPEFPTLGHLEPASNRIRSTPASTRTNMRFKTKTTTARTWTAWMMVSTPFKHHHHRGLTRAEALYFLATMDWAHFRRVMTMLVTKNCRNSSGSTRDIIPTEREYIGDEAVYREDWTPWKINKQSWT